MMFLLVFGLFAAYLVLPALPGWLIAFYAAGHREGVAAVALYAANVVLGLALLWLAVRYVPLLSVMGPPDTWFWIGSGVLGAIIGTAGAQRSARPFSA
ncbi:MAG TPA: hypothetical protein VG387_20620 [Rhizomicrobium sp.]|jgi:hypothetical protein|nr:hypothetical protein [Rhizomicrobium sp.]